MKVIDDVLFLHYYVHNSGVRVRRLPTVSLLMHL